MNNELYHYGIKGMKWGIRRYQNSDGSLTAAGKRRYERDVAENKAKKKENRITIEGPDPKRWAREDLSRTKRVVDTTSATVSGTKKLIDKSRSSKKNKMDLSSMSDKELRDKINRELLENQYRNLFSDANESRGRQYVDKTFEIVGGTLGLASSALGVALAIKELKG